MSLDGLTLAYRNRLTMLIVALRRVFSGESRQQLLYSILSLAGSGFISIGLRFVGGMIQGRFVGPEVLGYYTKFTIIPSYLMFMELGVFVSLARQYPYYIGSGKQDTALEYAANALGWNNILCVLQVIFFLVPMTIAMGHGDWMAALGWGTQVIVAPTVLYMSYLASTYRNSNEFVTWSKGSILLSIVSLLLLPLVTVWQFFAVCARNSIPNLVSSVYVHWKRPLKIKARFDLEIIKKMILFGAPLMVFGYISTSLWDAVTRTYILKLTDEKALGLYAFSGAICTAIRTVATSISQVFHPRIAMLYGTSGKNVYECFKYSLRGCVTGLAALLPLIALIYCTIDPLLRLFLPKYVGCIPIVKYLCWWAALPILDLPSQVLIVAKRTKEYGISVLIGFISFMVFISLYAYLDRPAALQEIVLIYVVCKVARALVADGFAWQIAWRTNRGLC